MPDIRTHITEDNENALHKPRKLNLAPIVYDTIIEKEVELEDSKNHEDKLSSETTTALPTLQDYGRPLLWMDICPDPELRLRDSIQISSLYAGSVFRGEQKSGRSSYEVTVTLQHVDLKESFLCGYLHIKGLTADYPELTTFFESEIIGPKHSFFTKKWDANDRTDLQHWDRFPSFRPYSKQLKRSSSMSNHNASAGHPPISPTAATSSIIGPSTLTSPSCLRSPMSNTMPFTYHFRNKDHIFMRWKEQFLVPDYRVKTINGASFAGFYYICYQLSKGEITGYYFHQNSEKFQQLNLRHVPQITFQQFEFR